MPNSQKLKNGRLASLAMNTLVTVHIFENPSKNGLNLSDWNITAAMTIKPTVTY